MPRVPTQQDQADNGQPTGLGHSGWHQPGADIADADDLARRQRSIIDADNSYIEAPDRWPDPPVDHVPEL